MHIKPSILLTEYYFYYRNNTPKTEKNHGGSPYPRPLYPHPGALDHYRAQPGWRLPQGVQPRLQRWSTRCRPLLTCKSFEQSPCCK